jgi:hypothetical protein
VTPGFWPPWDFIACLDLDILSFRADVVVGRTNTAPPRGPPLSSTIGSGKRKTGATCRGRAHLHIGRLARPLPARRDPFHPSTVDMERYAYRSGGDGGSASSFPWLPALISTAAIVGVSAYWFNSLVSEYGYEGALSYIWEGDPYPDIRDRMDALEEAEKQASKQESKLVRMEETLERSHLDSIDAADTSSVIALWQSHLPASFDLRTKLALLSSDFDKMAAKVDGVVSGGSDILKTKKGTLSRRLVKLMERVDALISFFTRGQ